MQKETIGLIYGKMADVLAAIEAIGKDSVNEHFRFHFRGIDSVMNALHPILAQHRVFYTPQVVDRKDDFLDGGKKHSVQLRVRFVFYAEDGSSVEAVTEGEGLDSGDKATNKAMSAALKYALLQTFCVPTEDIEDGDRESPERVTTQARQPAARAQSPRSAQQQQQGGGGRGNLKEAPRARQDAPAKSDEDEATRVFKAELEKGGRPIQMGTLRQLEAMARGLGFDLENYCTNDLGVELHNLNELCADAMVKSFRATMQQRGGGGGTKRGAATR